MSQRVLAGRIGYSRQYVSMAEWEDANLPSRELVAAVDAELAANGALNALRVRADAATKASRSGAAYGESGCAPGSVTPGVKAVESVVSAADRTSDELLDVLRRVHRLTTAVDPEIVDQLASRVHTFIEDYEILDGARLVDGLVTHRQLIDALTEDCGDNRGRRRLYEIAAQTSGLLGFVNAGFGNFELSRAYCYEAFQLGGVVQSTSLQAWVRGMQSYCEYYSGRYHAALQFAEDGLNYAARGPLNSARTVTHGRAYPSLDTAMLRLPAMPPQHISHWKCPTKSKRTSIRRSRRWLHLSVHGVGRWQNRSGSRATQYSRRRSGLREFADHRSSREYARKSNSPGASACHRICPGSRGSRRFYGTVGRSP